MSNRPEPMKCGECGAVLVIRGYTNVEKVGGVTVTDGTSFRPTCPAGHVPPFTFDEVLAFERRAVLAVLHDGRHVDGAVMRYARKTLGLKQTELALVLDVSAPTVSRWETGAEPVQRTTQLALAALVDAALTMNVARWPLPEARDQNNGTQLEVTPPFRRTG